MLLGLARHYSQCHSSTQNRQSTGTQVYLQIPSPKKAEDSPFHCRDFYSSYIPELTIETEEKQGRSDN